MASSRSSKIVPSDIFERAMLKTYVINNLGKDCYGSGMDPQKLILYDLECFFPIDVNQIVYQTLK